jgi:hypothetical protein
MHALLRSALCALPLTLVMNSAVVAFERGASFTILPGTTMGLPYAYTGTPGVYFYSLGNYGTGSIAHDVQPNIGKGPGSVNIDVADEIPAFVWTTPYKIFGATYAVLLAQPIAAVSGYGPVPGAGYVRSQGGGFRNTFMSPITLSWDLGNGFHIGSGFNMAVPDARTTGINGLDSAGQPYWTLEPNIGISYLHDGFDLSATMLYDIYTRNTYSNVLDGQAMMIDFTATKKFQHIEIGPVGYLAFQTTRDSGGNPLGFLTSNGAVNSCEPEPGGIFNSCVRAAKAGVGGKLGYDFGRGEIAVLATQSVYHHGQGATDGWRVWTQLSFKLYDDKLSPPLAAPFVDSLLK